MKPIWRVYYRGTYPQKKKQYWPGQFPSRRAARNWCRNHRFQYEGLTIVGPMVDQVERFN